jgi:hypothetical protein
MKLNNDQCRLIMLMVELCIANGLLPEPELQDIVDLLAMVQIARIPKPI